MDNELKRLKDRDEAPQWLTVEGYKTLSGGYMLKGETPKAMYIRVAESAAVSLGEPNMKERFFDAMWRNHLCPASPVLSNSGTDRGLTISCYGVDTHDSVDGIYSSVREMALLTKGGGGVGLSVSNIRGRGKPIRGGNNGYSEGVLPWIKVMDSAILATSQGSVRRGAASVNLDIDHTDFNEFLHMRKPKGDVNRQCMNLHHAAMVSDNFMNRVENGDYEARKKWVEMLKCRLETGEPYIMFKDTVNKANPDAYKNNNLDVSMTNICSEITLHTDDEHSFVCCLSSVNLARWYEWKDTDLIHVATKFLNGVLNEFISKAKDKPGMENSVRSAIKGRAIGIGALGWHTLLQQNHVSFGSFDAMLLNAQIFKKINEDAIYASRELAAKYGEPEWCKGTGMYNTHLTAVAPTRSNSIISGDLSAGIEPRVANAYVDKTSKGVFVRKNKQLEILLESYGKNTFDVWSKIVADDGSVFGLDFLSDQDKEVYRTAFEIDQMDIIKQAGQRQKFIDQSQSLNLFFPADADPKWFHDVHMEAWRSGVKTVYYCRSTSVIKGDTASRGGGCQSCEG